jgi:putative transposase
VPDEVNYLTKPALATGILARALRADTWAGGELLPDVAAESVIGLFKTELIKPRGPWRTVS